MRFSVAMDSLEKENKILRIVIIALLVLSVSLCLGILRVSQKNPLIIERGCISRMLSISPGESSKDEVQAFLEVALAERFNSKFIGNEFLSMDLQTAREQEHKELTRLSMKQQVVINSIEFINDKIIAQVDRLISSGDIRSAFKWVLEIEVSSVQRTEANPYGLILVGVKSLEDKTHKEVQSK